MRLDLEPEKSMVVFGYTSFFLEEVGIICMVLLLAVTVLHLRRYVIEMDVETLSGCPQHLVLPLLFIYQGWDD